MKKLPRLWRGVSVRVVVRLTRNLVGSCSLAPGPLCSSWLQRSIVGRDADASYSGTTHLGPSSLLVDHGRPGRCHLRAWGSWPEALGLPSSCRCTSKRSGMRLLPSTLPCPWGSASCSPSSSMFLEHSWLSQLGSRMGMSRELLCDGNLGRVLGCPVGALPVSAALCTV